MSLTSHRFKTLKREALESLDWHPENTSNRLVQLHPDGTIAKVWLPIEADDIEPGATVHVQQAPLLWAIVGETDLEYVEVGDMRQRGDFFALVPNAKGIREHWIVLTKAEALRTAKEWRLDQ